MTPGKAKIQKKITNTFCSRRKKRKFANKASFNENAKKTLAESDRGSWFNQEEQWQSNDSTSVALSLSSPSSSTKKLEASKQAFLNDSFHASSDSESDCFDSSEEISDSVGVIGDVLFAKPTGNYIINPSNIQELLQTIAVCKVCHSGLQIVEKVGSKQGFGAMWNIHCLNKTCTSHLNTQTLPITR